MVNRTPKLVRTTAPGIEAMSPVYQHQEAKARPQEAGDGPDRRGIDHVSGSRLEESHWMSRITEQHSMFVTTVIRLQDRSPLSQPKEHGYPLRVQEILVLPAPIVPLLPTSLKISQNHLLDPSYSSLAHH